MNLRYSKVRDVKSPERGTDCSAGIDFFVPEFDYKFQVDMILKNPDMNSTSFREGFFWIEPHSRVLIPSGIHVDLTNFGTDMRSKGFDGIAMAAKNKSGVASKKGLDRLAELVDEDYQGELHISLVNTGGYPMKIHAGEKLIQFVLVPVMYGGTQELPLDKLYSDTSMRGIGGFGSTDAKK